MPPIDQDELSAHLKAYLDREESERALGKTNEAILKAVASVSDALAAHKGENTADFAKVNGRIDVHDFRIGNVEKVAAKVQEKADSLAEDTGNHRIIVAERRADAPIKVLLAIMGAAMAVLGTLLVWALTRGH